MNRAILSGILVLVATVSVAADAQTTAPPPAAANEKTQQLVAAYKAADDATKKTDALKKLLEMKGRDATAAVFSLLRSSNEAEMACFRTALTDSGNVEVFLHLGPYLKTIAEAPAGGGTAAAEMQGRLALVAFAQKLELLQPELRQIAEKNPDVLVVALKEAYEDKSGVKTMAGPLTGLIVMEEKGFEALLKSPKTGGDEVLLTLVLPGFGPHAVVPTLKQMEDPASSEKQRDIAGLLIVQFSDAPPVVDKVVEAYQHGRYFELKVGTVGPDGKRTVSMADMVEASKGAWWNLLIHTYRGDKKFAQYVAEEHLPKADKQGKVIHLLTAVDFKTALPYLEKLDFNALSDESLQTLTMCFSPLSTFGESEDAGPSVEEKLRLFCKMFEGLKKERREAQKLMFDLANFPAASQQAFVIENFAKMTDEEKNLAIHVCAKLPAANRKKVYDTIRQGCSDEMKGTIKFYEEEAAKGDNEQAK
jgi:hypothetical protein